MVGTDWPVVGSEPVPWAGVELALPASRKDRHEHRGPYQAAVVPRIATRPLALSGSTAAVIEEAAAAIVRFDERMGGEIAPFSSILLRTESAASSRIENLTASARAIAEAEIGQSPRENAAEIVANTATMQAAVDLAARIDQFSILAMHDALMYSIDPPNAGRWRSQQVWIGGSDVGPHRAAFVPPQNSRVPAAIRDLIAFIEREDLPVLAQAAIAHAQFETIHPFIDGNGRTGRALVHSLLRNKQLTRNVTVPVSAGLLAETDDYFAALTAYRAGRPEVIILEFAQAAFRAVANGEQLVARLREVRAAWLAGLRVRRDSAAWALIDLLVRRPVLNSRVIAEELGVDVGNVHRYVDPLLVAGILTRSTDGRRNQVWRSVEVLAALDEFAVRAGRRRGGR